MGGREKRELPSMFFRHDLIGLGRVSLYDLWVFTSLTSLYRYTFWVFAVCVRLYKYILIKIFIILDCGDLYILLRFMNTFPIGICLLKEYSILVVLLTRARLVVGCLDQVLTPAVVIHTLYLVLHTLILHV